ncbi:MAG: crossover junction endodeoxyribonuclease RuvC [Bacteroidaceae bacterium]|jgi:crossover junction endodeoxyribonuclease RuvC|nr:crossover junction endodeoxyribonuclease RuvC [Bacteroidaceae bacterium]MBO7272853.1 crossover junction endodeoxyribonuclease RuvC [Bacteroidaceae bacterium]MBQ2290496.1 crossover junction endodeoxyribonuclease RuvC [Bacteroidaceae bacterium]MBQ5616881.1 crossover junction endodeoxyribonuclease RuvC [Bacteroidaceae bacterium]
MNNIPTPTDDKVIMGIDPGTNIMGYAFIGVNGNRARLIAMGVIDLRKCKDMYMKLGEIFTRVQGLINSFLPDELAIEAPFFGKNVQSMLKLGRAQGVAIAAAISRQVPIHEYAPLKIKMAITGNGSASKEQVADMLRRMLNISNEDMPHFMDATDALGAAFCHFIQRGNPVSEKKFSSWADYVNKNPGKVR